MSYKKKYWYQFTSLDGKVNKVELWHDTATVLTAEEVESMSMPFSVEMPDLDHKFQVVRGTGCEINLLSSTDRKFFAGLYHTQMKEFMIKHYIDEVINWVGYLNSELVRESYSEFSNYPFQITGNDGFALLDRLYFVDANGLHYAAPKSKFDLLQIALTRVGLPYSNIYISLSTTFTGQSADADKTILHESYVDSSNFYNEDNEPETLRKVIESILRPLEAFITQIGGNIWITDVNTLAIGSGVFKQFDQSTGIYVDSSTVDLVKDISDIGYMGTGSDIEMSGGKNKQVLSYSPYPLKSVLPEALNGLNEFSGVIPGSFSRRDDDHYEYRTLTVSDKLAAYAPGSFEQSYRRLGLSNKLEYLKDASVCLAYHAGTAATKVCEFTVNPNISISQGKTVYQTTDILFPTRVGRAQLRGISIKLSGEIEFYRYWTSGTGDHDGGIRSFKIKTLFRIGNKTGYTTDQNVSTEIPNSTPRTNPTPQINVGSAESGYWLDYPGTPQKFEYINFKKSDNSDVSGEWQPFELNFFNSIDLSGQVYFEIYSELDYVDDNGKEWTNTNVHHAQVRIRNLSMSIIDPQTGNEIGDADIEYIGYLDKTLKEEAEKIELICGTDATFTDRGKIMKLISGSYSSIKEWTRNAQTYKIEELLLASLSANYKMGYLTISNLKLQNSFNQLSVLTDTGIISDKKFMIKSMNKNFRDNLIETQIVEITPDNLTIVKE